MKPPAWVERPIVWLAISNLVLACVVVYLFTVNRTVIDQQRRDLEKICNTTLTLDIALVVPLHAETSRAIVDLPPGSYRNRLIRLRDNLETAHEALSETQSCESVR